MIDRVRTAGITVAVCLFGSAVALAQEPDPTPVWRQDLAKVLAAREAGEAETILEHKAHERAEVRAAVAQFLPAVVGADAIPALAAMTLDADERVGVAAVHGLMQIGGDDVVAPLRRAFADGQLEVVRQLVVDLGEFRDPRFMKELGALLAADDPDVRAGVLGTVQAIGHADGLPILLAGTGDAAPRVRSAAVRAIQSLGDPRALPRLALLLESKDMRFRTDVLLAMVTLGGLEAHEDAMRESFFGGDPPLRAAVFAEMKRFPSARAKSIFERYVKNKDAFLRSRQSAVQAIRASSLPEADDWIVSFLTDAEPGIRSAAVKALGERKSPATFERLKAVAKDVSPDVRTMLAFQLGSLSEAKPLTTLSVLMADSAADVRAAAATASVRLGTPEALAVAAKALEDEDAFVRSGFVFALTDSPLDAEANALLRRAMDDDELEIRLTAIQALGRRKDPKAAERLRELAGSDSEMLRRAARNALRAIDASTSGD